MSSKGQKVLDLLKRTDFETAGYEAEQFDSLFEINSEFMEWLCDYVDDSNILQPSMFLEVDVSQEFELLNEGIDKALEEAGIDKEDLEVKESDIQLLEKELQLLDSQIKIYDEMIEQSRHECQEMEIMAHQLKEDVKVSKQLMLDAEKECCVLGDKLDKIYQTIADSLSSLGSTFSHIKENPSEVHLMAQVPLHRYEELVNVFNSLLSKYMLLQFPNLFPQQDGAGSERDTVSIPSVLIGRSADASAKLKCEINRLQNSISLVLLEVVLLRSEVKSWDSAIVYLKELEVENEMENCQRLTREIGPEEAVFSDLIGETKRACTSTTELEILKVFFSPDCVHKMLRQQYWIDKLSVLVDCLKKQLRLGGTLKTMINVEADLIAEVIDVTNQFQNYLTHENECFMIRKAGMEKVIHDFQNTNPVLKEMFEPLVVSGDEDLNTALSRLKRGFDTSTVLSKKEIIRKNEQSIREFQKIVFSGPTRKLFSFGPHFPVYVQVERILNELEKNMVKQRHEKEIYDKDANLNPYRKKKSLLWVYYLTNPQKLVALLAELKSAVDSKMFCGKMFSPPFKCPPDELTVCGGLFPTTSTPK